MTMPSDVIGLLCVGQVMAPRRRFDRAPLDNRSYRELLDGRMERYDRYSRGYEPSEARYGRYDQSFNRPAGPSELDQDFAAMKRVWQMIRAGAVRMVGEIGRQY